jgi:hypothetical protein
VRVECNGERIIWCDLGKSNGVYTLRVDAFVDQPPTFYAGSIPLVANHKYKIRIDYYENAGGAVAQLFWTSPSTPFQIVPQTQLYSSYPDALAPSTIGLHFGADEPLSFGSSLASLGCCRSVSPKQLEQFNRQCRFRRWPRQGRSRYTLPNFGVRNLVQP